MNIDEKINVEFRRWYLNNKLTDFQDVTPHDRVLHGCANVFSAGGQRDLTINLIDGQCTDSEGLEYPFIELVAEYRSDSVDRTRHHLEVEYGKWQEREKVEKQYQKFERDEEHLCWKKKTGDDSSEEITEFDIIINSIVESYDLKVNEWNRKFECTVRYHKYDKLLTKGIELETGETNSFTNFKDAIWDKVDNIPVKNLSNAEMLQFWKFIDNYYQPRIVREFRHYGFIEFEEEKYFMAENVLVKFPDYAQQPLQLIAKEEGAFKVEENKYVKPSEDIIRLPNFELGVPQNGQYKAAMNRLFDDKLFEKKLKTDVIDEFCSMVGGQSEFRQWGKLLVGYIFSYIYFEDIYERFNHTIFLYFFGRGNVGKGEVVKRILDFYGLSYQDMLSKPRARSVDNAIEQKSQIPLWIDEHVPDVPGEENNIGDQEWNSWFELKMRQTNIQKGVSYAIERKAVRTMPVFCSNYRPKSDHLLSRCLILEYKRKHRGPEKHVYNLKNNRELLQRLMLSYMQKYKLLDRKAFRWDIGRMRSNLKKDVKAELSKRSGDAIMQDRQISQFATLITVYHWLFAEYREDISAIYGEVQRAENESDEIYRKEKYEVINMNLADLTFDEKLYDFVKKQTTKAAVKAAQHDPFTDYIESISALIESGKITEKDFYWKNDGTLKIWAKAVWDKYLQSKKGTNDIVRREIVEDKLREMSRLDPEGGLKAITWTPSSSAMIDDNSKTIRCKGFYIPKANENELLAMGFQVHKFNPQAAVNDKYNPDGNGPAENSTNETHIDDDIPF